MMFPLTSLEQSVGELRSKLLQKPKNLGIRGPLGAVNILRLIDCSRNW